MDGISGVPGQGLLILIGASDDFMRSNRSRFGRMGRNGQRRVPLTLLPRTSTKRGERETEISGPEGGTLGRTVPHGGGERLTLIV